jgi:TolB-like protein
MTQLDVMYRYDAAPTEAAMMALGRVREVYGIRRLHVDEHEKTVRVEYDATRLTEAIVHQLLRRAGLDVVERVSLVPPQAV